MRMRIQRNFDQWSDAVLAEIVQRYGNGAGFQDQGTTLPLGKTSNRGIRIEDIPDIFNRLLQAGMTCVQSGMDNVRNITGSPVAGIDADELIDTRGLVRNLQDMITNNGGGNRAQQPATRKFNIAVVVVAITCPCQINDLGFIRL